MHYIYVITNRVNNKVYVGQSIKPASRWSTHKSVARLRPSQPFHFAIRKYGELNFGYELIACTRSQEDADYAEIEIISQFDSRNKLKGYNILPGGQVRSGSNHPNWGKHLSAKTRAKIGIASASRIHSLESRSKMSVSQQMYNANNPGRRKGCTRTTPYSSEEKLARSLAMLGKHKSVATEFKKGMKAINPFPKGHSYNRKLTDESIQKILLDTRRYTEIAKDYNVSRRTIGRVKQKIK